MNTPVISGVTHGMVFGLLLVLTYINDLPDCVNSNVKLFTVDLVLYQHVNSPFHYHYLFQILLKLVEAL